MMFARARQKILVIAAVKALLFAVTLFAQQTPILISESIIQQRLSQYKGNDSKRRTALKQLFLEAGCDPVHLTEQVVPTWKQPNVICVLPGTTAATIIVGAHFDHVDVGDGIVDNWSGASLLPSLFQSLAAVTRKHTFVFIGFMGEERGLIGSDFYVSQLKPKQLAAIQAMINLDTLGLGPTEVWTSQSDPRLVNTIAAMARSINLPISGMNVDGFGESDEESFIARKVCTLMIHTLTPDNAHILHHFADNPTAIHHANYYDTFRLLAAYLPALDELTYPVGHTCTTQAIDTFRTTNPFRRRTLRH